MSRGGRLVLGIGLALLALAVTARLRWLGWRLTEGELLVAYWPAWLLVVALVAGAAVLLGDLIR